MTILQDQLTQDSTALPNGRYVNLGVSAVKLDGMVQHGKALPPVGGACQRNPSAGALRS